MTTERRNLAVIADTFLDVMLFAICAFLTLSLFEYFAAGVSIQLAFFKGAILFSIMVIVVIGFTARVLDILVFRRIFSPSQSDVSYYLIFLVLYLAATWLVFSGYGISDRISMTADGHEILIDGKLTAYGQYHYGLAFLKYSLIAVIFVAARFAVVWLQKRVAAHTSGRQ